MKYPIISNTIPIYIAAYPSITKQISIHIRIKIPNHIQGYPTIPGNVLGYSKICENGNGDVCINVLMHFFPVGWLN